MDSDKLVIERVLSLKDQSPFILIQDNFTQSSKLLINEILARCNFSNSVRSLIYLGYETSFIPGYIKENDLFIDCLSEDGDTELGIYSIIQKVEQYLNESTYGSSSQAVMNNSSSENTDVEMNMNSNSNVWQLLNQNTSQIKKTLIIIDSLNYIKLSNLVSTFLSGLAQLNRNNNLTILATLHESIVETSSILNNDANQISIYPCKQNLLNFLATNVLSVSYYYENSHNDEEEINSDFKVRFYPSLQLNKCIFEVNLIKFKKTGKKVQYDFIIDTETHKIISKKDLQKTENEQAGKIEEDLLRGLSTFNLNTSLKQQKAREQVDLPFLDAQSFQNGGAIVYQFEKDDDYDEEDPYEDPF